MTTGKRPELTEQERQVLQLLLQGSRTSEIAKRLQLDYKTVAETCKRVKCKLQAKTTADLAAWVQANRQSGLPESG